MSASSHIFFDPSGKRRKVARVVLGVSLVTILTSVIVGIVLFLGTPLVSQSKSQAPQAAPVSNLLIRAEVSPELIKQSRDNLVQELAQSRAWAKNRRSISSTTHSTAFINTLDENALAAIRAHVDAFTTLSPAWLTLNEGEERISEILFDREVNPLTAEIEALAREHSATILPRLIDISSESGQPGRLLRIFGDDAHKRDLANQVIQFLQREELPGVLIDFRVHGREESDHLVTFIAHLSEQCRAGHKEIGVVLYTDDAVDVQKLSGLVDTLTLVNAFGAPDRTRESSLTTFSNKLQSIEQVVAPEKITVAFASGALRTQSSSRPEVVSFSEALSEAHNGAIEFDPSSGTSFFRSTDQGGALTRTWILDAPFSYNSKKLASEGAIQNFGIWNVGNEDSGVWELLDTEPSLAELSHVPPTGPLSSIGRGDLLTPRLVGAAEGGRKIQVDEQSGLITKVTYESIPASAGTLHSGYREKKISLTFDDGPVEPYTSQVLDILKAHDVKATFFVIGEHVLENPELLERIYAEGHDIGNHSFTHPDLSLVSRNRVLLELNAAQRAIQTVLGHSVVLFRPPYVSETSPLSAEEFRVLNIAQELGYTTVGISNNGRDWVAYEESEDGTERERGGEDVANEILSKIELMSGNAILLHDGPKDRERSVAALPILINKLKAQGYFFVTTHELMGVSREEVFPKVSASALRATYKTFLQVGSSLSATFSVLFIVIVSLSVVRLALILVCAILAKVEERQNPCSAEELDAARDIPVSIIIAAYNEEKVIAHTLKSLLEGNHRAFEIIVVDDGSTDRTSEVVREHFSGERRVTLVTQRNGGKPAALNHGIQFARHDILVCLDADTQFDPDAVSYMARHFLDSRVGAVAGNIKVGNRRSVLTHWQSMEYITNISIGRRAYGYLNAVMVVAGAAGAWRRSAVEQAGGYHTDSLAEDMDLTWRVRTGGWDVVNEPLAIGYTEAPENFRGLYKQRFRWSYGALQCLWKHRNAVGKHGFFGWLGIPSIFIFGVVFEVLAPLADLKMILALIGVMGLCFSGHPIYVGSLEYTDLVAPMITTAWLYVIFFGVELMISVLAFLLDREDMRPLWLLFFQRFIYRQLMYFVAWRALWKAITGWRQGWGTLQRTGTVSLPSS
jgi:poly-beta-1,6 N-acetyl-D-glucosamine synthase